MKTIKFYLVFVLVVILLSAMLVFNAEYTGGGGDFGAPHQEEEYQEDVTTNEEASDTIIQLLRILIFSGTPITAYIIYECKLSQSARASRKIMKMLDQKDSAWKFKNIMSRFKEIFNALKNAQIKSNFDLVTQYTTDDMLEKLKLQQTWAQQLQKIRTPSYIKLLDARPVAVFDSYDDACDHIWFYVEWSAFEQSGEYSTTKQLNTYKGFWQLKRCCDVWRLSDIIDKEKGDELIFGTETETQTKQSE